ncbi:MAG TPA: acetyl-CoA carboxylase biotin carboxyl carrier protein subunit [Dongiaceae bacterium]|jgi:acetyl-CoA carboxylase biotin carboxyl carrier protein
MPKFDIDEALLRKLAALLSETGLTEIEYENQGQRVRVNRGGGHVTYAVPGAAAAQPAAASAPASPAGPPAGAVVSPMVGTAYLAAEPGGTPLVNAGDKVKKGQTLLIIEAMKVMNPIPAPEGGTVEAILIGDGQPVEFGEPLMVIR